MWAVLLLRRSVWRAAWGPAEQQVGQSRQDLTSLDPVLEEQYCSFQLPIATAHDKTWSELDSRIMHKRTASVDKLHTWSNPSQVARVEPALACSEGTSSRCIIGIVSLQPSGDSRHQQLHQSCCVKCCRQQHALSLLGRRGSQSQAGSTTRGVPA